MATDESDVIKALKSSRNRKRFCMFQIVASVQKDGEVVAQQSSTKIQP